MPEHIRPIPADNAEWSQHLAKRRPVNFQMVHDDEGRMQGYNLEVGHNTAERSSTPDISELGAMAISLADVDLDAAAELLEKEMTVHH